MSGALSGAVAGAQAGSGVGPWGVAIGATLGLFMGSKIDKENRKRVEDNYKAQVSAMVQTYNYANQSTDLEVQAAADQAASDLAQTQANSIQNLASIRAAAAETGMEGNSMDRVMRAAKGSDLRAEDSIRENYSRTVAQSLLIKQTNRTSTQRNLTSLRDEIKSQQPSKWAQLMSLGQQAGSLYNQYQQTQAIKALTEQGGS